MNKLLLIIICLILFSESHSKNITSLYSFGDKNIVSQYFSMTKSQFLKEKYIHKRVSFADRKCDLLKIDIDAGFEAICRRTGLGFYRTGLRFPKNKQLADLIAFNITPKYHRTWDEETFETFKKNIKESLAPEFFVDVVSGFDSFGDPGFYIVIKKLM
jgi:hypothetical protein